MSRYRPLLTLIAALLLVILLSSCNGQQSVPPTPVPPTATVVPPTNTPLPTDTPQPTATPTPTETPTPTPEIPPEMSAEMDQIEAQISNMRGLTLSEDFQPEVYDQAELEQYYTGQLDQQYPAEDEFQDLVTLSYLGLIPPDMDLYALLTELYAEQSFGFYDVNSNQMILVQGAEMDALGRLSYAMQIVQAMLDEAVDLDGAFGYNNESCNQNSDQCAARQALIAGDSALTGSLWMLANLSPAEQTDIATRSAETAQDSVLATAPLFFQEDNSFPVTVGSPFVSYLYQQGGWAAVDQAYQNPPQSTEHIMHPDRYPADTPKEVTLPDLLPVLGEGWDLLDQNTLGEWKLLLMLTSGVDPVARQEIQSALSAVNGWGGDLYSTYFNPDTGQVVLVSKVQWDNPADAEEFYNMLGTHVIARFDSINTDSDLLDMFNYMMLGYAQWYYEGDTSYYVISPSQEISEVIMAAVVGE